MDKDRDDDVQQAASKRENRIAEHSSTGSVPHARDVFLRVLVLVPSSLYHVLHANHSLFVAPDLPLVSLEDRNLDFPPGAAKERERTVWEPRSDGSDGATIKTNASQKKQGTNYPHSFLLLMHERLIVT